MAIGWLSCKATGWCARSSGRSPRTAIEVAHLFHESANPQKLCHHYRARSPRRVEPVTALSPRMANGNWRKIRVRLDLSAGLLQCKCTRGKHTAPQRGENPVTPKAGFDCASPFARIGFTCRRQHAHRGSYIPGGRAAERQPLPPFNTCLYDRFASPWGGQFLFRPNPVLIGGALGTPSLFPELIRE